MRRARINHLPHYERGNQGCSRWNTLPRVTQKPTQHQTPNSGVQSFYHILHFSHNWRRDIFFLFFPNRNLALDITLCCWNRWGESLTTGEFRERKHCCFQILWMTVWWLHQYSFKIKEKRVKPSCLMCYLVSWEANKNEYISVGLELIFGIKVSQSGFDSIKNNVVLFEIARQFFFLLLTLTFNLLFTKWS